MDICLAPFTSGCPANLPPQAAARRIGLGITLVEATFSDNRLIRFRVLSRDSAAVRAIAAEALPEHEKVVEAWLDTHSGRSAA